MTREPVDGALARRQLLELGVSPGATLMVHASLRRTGPMRGGAEALLGAIRDALGKEGTLLMLLCADPDEPFDAVTTPVDRDDMGILAEVFRTAPGVRVNDHAAARFAAAGPGAEHLLEPMPVHDYYGPGTPLARFVAGGGSVLRLGADIDTVTLTHHAEYLAALPHKRRVRRRYVRADVGEQFIESLDDTDGIAVWPRGDYFPQILRDFIDQGGAVLGPVGHVTAELFGARPFVEFAVAWLQREFGASEPE